MFAACKRVFKDKVVVVDEFRSTMTSLKHGTKKEIVYKIRLKRWMEIVTRRKDKHRRGGTSKDWIMNGIGDPDNPKNKKKKVIRYPEVRRGLRFNPKDGMSAQPKRQRLVLRDLDRDREAALTIAGRFGGPQG